MDKIACRHVVPKSQNRAARRPSTERVHRQRKRRHKYVLEEQLRSNFKLRRTWNCVEQTRCSKKNRGSLNAAEDSDELVEGAIHGSPVNNWVVRVKAI